MMKFFTLLLMTAIWNTSAMATEEIKYDLIQKEGNIEIRDYQPVVIAEVTVESTRRDATGAAFRILFDYISGNNIAQQKIPMTAPVSQEAIPNQEIPMTTPVTQEEAGDNLWRVAFYMPADMTMDTAPKPKSDKITMREVKFGKMAAIRFSGRGTDDNINLHDAELLQYLKEKNMAFDPEGRVIAFYDAPFKPWFLRRNEVMYPLK